MTIAERLDAAIDAHRLLDHPFYRAWSAGTLPVTALQRYASEYGAFIAAIDAGWDRVGQADHAAEERHHAELWNRFAARFGAVVTDPATPEAVRLLATARRHFADPGTAWGSLYAFEAQQPATTEEKLKGLATHYGVPVDDPSAEYFRIHATDYHEAAMIVAALERSPDADAAVAACAEMAQALWDALTGIQG